MTTVRLRDEISALHPALAGHFPGDPIVPGVVVLRRVCRAVTRERGGTVASVPVVKFHQPLRPAEPFNIDIEPAGDDRYRFRVVRGNTVIAAGTVQVSATAP
jgi:3-hydroxymyristoyl/3-hydroxydecanoyl-(acyl carrier protein) dehydratase